MAYLCARIPRAPGVFADHGRGGPRAACRRDEPERGEADRGLPGHDPRQGSHPDAHGEASHGDPARRGNAALTLGCIGAKEAVHLLIALSRQANGVKSYLVALGRIGSPQAVQYLVENLREHGAADALVAAGDKSVVPALESALAETRARSEGNRDRLREQELELAILQLKPDDPSSALLQVLEDRKNDTDLRTSAAALLHQRRMIEGNLVQEARLAAIYLAEEDHDVREQCASALENSRARGVTAAMLRHAVSWNPDPTRKTSGPAWLIWSLNRRLGTSFQTLDDVKRYVEETGSPK